MNFLFPEDQITNIKISTLSSLSTNLQIPVISSLKMKGGRIYSGFYLLLTNRYEITIITPCPTTLVGVRQPPTSVGEIDNVGARQPRQPLLDHAPIKAHPCSQFSHSCFYYQYKTNQIQVAIFLRRLKTTKYLVTEENGTSTSSQREKGFKNGALIQRESKQAECQP